LWEFAVVAIVVLMVFHISFRGMMSIAAGNVGYNPIIGMKLIYMVR